MLLPSAWRAAAAAALLLILGITPRPKHLASAVQMGSTAAAGGHPSEALAAWSVALLLQPELHQVRELALRAALQAEAPELASEHFSLLSGRAVELNLPCLRAELALMRGDPEESLRELNAGCTQATGLAERISSGFEAQGDIPSAIRALQHAPKLPISTRAHMAVLTATQDPEQAYPTLIALPSDRALAHELAFAIERARAIDDRAYVFAQVGQTLARAAQWRLAGEAFRNALQLSPDYAEARAYLGLSIDQVGGNGYEHLKRAIDLKPDSSLAHLLLGRHWLLHAEYSQAMLAFETAADLEPESALIAAELGLGYQAAGEVAQAMEAFVKAVELEGDNAYYWGLLADFAIEQELEVANLGLVAARVGVRLAPEDAIMHARLASAYYLLGNLPLAERSLSQAIQLDPAHPMVQYRLGLLRFAQGDVERGKAALNAAIELDPEGPIADLALRTLDRLAP